MIFLQLFLSFVKIGFCSFGGMSMIPVINQEMLSHGWMTTEELADIVAIAEMTPGSIGINCATFVGMRTQGIPGACLATFGVMVPSLTLTLLAAHFMKLFRENHYVNGAMFAIRPVCLGMIAATLISMTQSNLVIAGAFSWLALLIAVVCGVLLIQFKLPTPLVIVAAAVLGLILL